MAEGAPTTPYLWLAGIGVVYASSFLISSRVSGAGDGGGVVTFVFKAAGGLSRSFIAI